MRCRFCNADENMRCVTCYDDPQEQPLHAYNVYQCPCGAICKEDVWEQAGELWISRTNRIEHEFKINH